MHLRLTLTTGEGAAGIIIRAAGRLTASGAAELGQLVRSVEGPVAIDLASLMSTDDAGVATLRALADQGVRLIGTSRYISLLLARGEQEPTRRRRRK